ncbi:MAG: PIG-L family deacetylase [Chitinivibrionales bacterium]|nr:PIG-L family deacetylase [Chitinivibrionales bacterium]
MPQAPVNILAIGSHPDDIEFGCGGTLYKFAQKGHRVFAYILTRGGFGGNPNVRSREQTRSQKLLGITSVFWGAFTDTRLHFFKNVVPSIEKVVQETKPAFVFVHHGKDTHQDHRNANTSAVSATRNIPNILFYEGPTSYNFEPNVFVDIKDQLPHKIASLACHDSQVMKTNINQQSILDIAKATATFRGTQCRVRFAEAFCSLRMFINI